MPTSWNVCSFAEEKDPIPLMPTTCLSHSVLPWSLPSRMFSMKGLQLLAWLHVIGVFANLLMLIENPCSRSILIKQQRLEIFNFPLLGSQKHPLISSLCQCQSLKSLNFLCQHTPIIKQIFNTRKQENKQNYQAFSSYFSLLVFHLCGILNLPMIQSMQF